MKILHIGRKDTGGASIAMLRTLDSLRQHAQSYQSDLLLLYKNNPSTYASSFRDLAKSPLQKLHLRWMDYKQVKFQEQILAMGRAPHNAEAYLRSAYDVCKHPAVAEADLIHLHHVVGFVDMPSLYKKMKKPIVWTFHDMSPFTGGYPYHFSLPIEVRKKIDQENLPKKRAWFNRVPTYGIATSRYNYDAALSSGLFPEERLIHIPYSINMDLFRPFDQELCRSIFGVPEHQKVLMFIAVDVANTRKGGKVLFENLDYLKKLDYHILVVGSWAEDMTSFYRDNNIHWVGRIDDQRLLALAYSAADVFVTPSFEEAFGQTTLEALACGTPVVSYPTAGSLDLITSGQNGNICEDYDNSNAFIDCIEECYQWQLSSLKVRSSVVELYSHSNQANKHRVFYERIFSENER